MGEVSGAGGEVSGKGSAILVEFFSF